MAEKILGEKKKQEGTDLPQGKKKHYETTEIKSLIASLWANSSMEQNKAFRNRFLCMYIKRFKRDKGGNVNQQGKD